MQKVLGYAMLFLVAVSCLQSQIYQLQNERVKVHWNWLQNSDNLQQKIELFHTKLNQQPFKEVDLSFTYCENPKFITQHILTQTIRAEIVRINLDSCKLGSQGIDSLLQLINKDYVKSLDLKLDSIQSSERMGDVLGKRLSQFDLRFLRLSLTFGIDFKGFVKLISYPLNPAIESVILDFSNNDLPHTALQNFKEYFSNMNAEKVWRVELNFNANKLGQKGAEFVSSSLSQFVNISHLRVQLYFNNLKAKGTGHVTGLVKKLPKLIELSLNFDMNHIQTQGGQYIGQSLALLQNLRVLQIGVARKNFGFNGYAHIIQAIQKFTQLNQLTLRCGVNRVGFKGAQKLAAMLQNLKFLEYLSLQFVQNAISDQGIKVIAQSVENLPLLTKLQLNLGFNQAANYGLVEVVKMIERRKFKSIKLGLSNNAFQDVDIKLIFSPLKSILKTCQQFDLELLQTKISQPLKVSLESIFVIQSKTVCHANIYVNSKQAVQKAHAQLQQFNKDDARSKQL